MSCFWRHKWKKWEAIATGRFYTQEDAILAQGEEPKLFRGSYEKQRRECEVCGKSQLREART